MKEVVEYIVKNLVSHPDEVIILEQDEKNLVIIKIIVSQDDMGRIIGKNGRVASAIRVLVRSLGKNNNQRVIVKIGDDK